MIEYPLAEMMFRLIPVPLSLISNSLLSNSLILKSFLCLQLSLGIPSEEQRHDSAAERREESAQEWDAQYQQDENCQTINQRFFNVACKVEDIALRGQRIM